MSFPTKRLARVVSLVLALSLCVSNRHWVGPQVFTGSCAHTSQRSSGPRSRTAVTAAAESCLAQLASMTTLSIDTGDLTVIKEYAETGLITDATTNPLFVSQAGLSGDPVYVALLEDAIAYARKSSTKEDDFVELAMDKLAVNLGVAISKLVSGYISTEVDPRLSFNKEETLRRARRIIALYEEAGIPRSRVLIKLAATWEGIAAMKELESEGITCNMTLVFGFAQAVAAAQYGARLISPFPGRILDFHKKLSGKDIWEPEKDPGVVAVRRMYSYYKRYGYDTICMPASWRPSRGAGHDLDEIEALAGVDRMTIPPGLLEQLATGDYVLERKLQPEACADECPDEELFGGAMSEADFRLLMNQDACATEKTAEGLRAFIADTDKLEAAIREKLIA
ncbi:Transaldolase [Durusdinium trenchii]|uniref:Transaldolase n=1 Tax=Durusdinium trenchii TaxID=1381693 RepID=A0ABP0LXG0_9DINO